VIENTDIIKFCGAKRYNGETYYKYQKRCNEKTKKKLETEGWKNSLKLARTKDVGWTVSFLKAPLDLNRNNDYIVNGLKVTSNIGTGTTMFFYKPEEVLPAMRILSERFNRSSSKEEVCDYLLSAEFVEQYNKEIEK